VLNLMSFLWASLLPLNVSWTRLVPSHYLFVRGLASVREGRKGEESESLHLIRLCACSHSPLALCCHSECRRAWEEAVAGLFSYQLNFRIYHGFIIYIWPTDFTLFKSSICGLIPFEERCVKRYICVFVSEFAKYLQNFVEL